MKLAKFLGALVVLALVGWVAYAGITWLGYGRGGRGAGDGDGTDSSRVSAMLDRHLPTYEVAENHDTRVNAPAEVTYRAAREVDLQRSGIAQMIFKARELLMGVRDPDTTRYRTTLEQIRALGWSTLEDVPGRAMVFGAVTQPWESTVRFQGLPPDQFAAFQEPGYAKIVWTLEAEPIDAEHSIFRTRTRVATTDPQSRERFRKYWAQFSPGIVLIRKQALGLVKAEAERRAMEGRKPGV